METKNNNMAINSYLPALESKKKLSKQRQNHGYGECFDGFPKGGWYRGNG